MGIVDVVFRLASTLDWRVLRDISYNTIASVFLTREPFEVCDLCPLSSSLKVSEVTQVCQLRAVS